MAKQKIAVLGGGIGSLSAVFEITNQPGWQDNFEITVYQLGWRLGGKGASGRNAAMHDRIEEHGLHVWGGFYENSFRVIQKCYDELKRPADMPLATWDKAFTRQPLIVLLEQINGEWLTWAFNFPEKKTQPGNPTHPDDPAPPSSFFDYVFIVLQWIQNHAHQLLAKAPAVQEAEGCINGVLNWLKGVESRVDADLKRVYTWLEPLILPVEAELKQFGATLEHQLVYLAVHLGSLLKRDGHQVHDPDLLLRILDELRTLINQRVQDRLHLDNELRRLYILFDFCLTHLRGALADDLFEQPFDSVNDVEYTAWLKKHGGSDVMTTSTLIETIYQTVFAYEAGDKSKPNVETGTMLRNHLRLIRYKGAMLYKMNAGMGDAIFAPLYEVLARRGVQFKFFHRVKKLNLTPDKNSIASIEIAEQVKLKDENVYEPLRMVENLPCWGSEPNYQYLDPAWAQKLIDGKVNLESFWAEWQDYRDYTLLNGTDFDLVILGIPINALRHLCADFTQPDVPAGQAWRDMLANVQTVPTQAFQLWMSCSLAELGWKTATPVTNGYLVNMQQPNLMDTWADMSHLIDRESWAKGEVKSIAYFCGVYPDAPLPPHAQHGYPQHVLTQVGLNTSYVADNIRGLWQNAAQPGSEELNWNLLVAPEGTQGRDRLNAQYIRANIDPSERYTLTLRDTTRYRLSPGNSGFTNLYLTGDWTDNRYNLGMIEATVMGGMMVSRALTGVPQVIPGEHDFE